jgi:hypothetical protein
MKLSTGIALAAIVLFLASCSSAAEKASGSYTGPYSSTSLPNGTGTGTAHVIADGGDKVDITFTSAGNPDIVISDVTVTSVINVLILDLPSSSSGSMSATVTGNMLSIAYNDDTQSLSFNGNK